MIYLLSNSKPLLLDNKVTHLPMIEFKTLQNNLDISKYDLLIFTSKQAVKSVNSLTKDWCTIPAISIGSATSNTIESLGGKVEYEVTTSTANSIVDDIVKKYSKKNILYIRAKEVALDIKEELKHHNIEIYEKVVYETSCISYSGDSRPKDGSVILFTSPSTINCFFKQFSWEESYNAVSIGQNTANHLPSEIVSSISNEANIESCIQKAKEILLSSKSK